MKYTIIKFGKCLGQACIQALTWICIGLLTGMGIAVGFWASTVNLFH